MTYIRHITLQTAHSRNIEKSEISAESIEFCTDLITSCLLNPNEKVSIKNFDGYYFSAGNTGGKSLFGTVWYGELPLVTFVVAKKSRNAAKVWQELHRNVTLEAKTDVKDVPSVPFIAVSVQVTANLVPDAMSWLGDFERCIAWAWMDYE